MNCKLSSQSAPLLSVKNLSFQRNHHTLLDKLSFNVPTGKLTSLVGPNGVGKSTLLRMLSGYLNNFQGECWFNQRSISHYTPQELAQSRAVMRQHSQLNFPFSVKDVILMGGYHRRLQEVDFYLDEVIDATDCHSLLHKSYCQLSGGEQQRIQLARALLQIWSNNMQGKILFLDEPTSAFDLHYQQRCLRLMKKLCRERNLTVFCILHDLNLSSLYSDHILLLAEKHIQAQGPSAFVLTEDAIHRWYGAEVKVLPHHATETSQIQFCY